MISHPFGAFNLLKSEYGLRRPEIAPPKVSIPLRMVGSLPIAFVNVMTAKLSNGIYGTKIVHVDEATKKMSGRTLVFSAEGAVLKDLDSEAVTTNRCGLMATFAVEKFYGRGRSYKNLRVGFIGAGRINKLVLEYLHTILDIKDFVVKAHPSRPEKAFDFHELAKPVDHISDLSDCDVVITCTTSSEIEDTLDIESFYTDSGIGPDLFISMDGGWLLDESFRAKALSFSDDSAQLALASHEFIWDEAKPKIDRDLNHMFFTKEYSDATSKPAVAYLYGIATADVVTAIYMGDEVDDTVGTET